MSSETAEAEHNINQRIFETSLDLILVVSREGNLIRVSPSSLHILGYAPAEMVGCNAGRFVHPDDLASTREEMRQGRLGQETRNFDCRYMHKDGHAVPMAWTGVWSEPEQQHFYIGRDMTERVLSEERARRSQRLEAVGQLTGGIAHDFNNLLTVVVGNLELVRLQLAPDHPLQRRLQSAERAALRGAELTGQLLTFARQQPLDSRAFNMNECVAETMELLRRTLGEHVAISTRLADDLWPTFADSTRFESALVNLSLNARDAMPTGGRLVIETRNIVLDEKDSVGGYDVPAGSYTALAVSDTGTGMPPDVLARAFEPFFTTKDPNKGTGMGLSMVFGFAHQSRGGVRLYSEVGHGTTVRLYLPRAETGAAAEAASPPPPEGARPGEAVLVAEDNEEVRQVAVDQLRELGYRVVEAEGGDEALRWLRGGEPIDLLFSDVVMAGGMNGYELARAARALRPGLKVLLTSGFALSEDRSRRGENWPLLNKPYRKAELAARVRACLDG